MATVYGGGTRPLNTARRQQLAEKHIAGCGIGVIHPTHAIFELNDNLKTGLGRGGTDMVGFERHR